LRIGTSDRFTGRGRDKPQPKPLVHDVTVLLRHAFS
jgi:hypothetical protein